MTAVTTRDALTKALAELEPGWGHVADCGPEQIGWGARQGYLSVAQSKADRILASGAVVDAATLAEELRGMGEVWGGGAMWVTTGTHVADLMAETVAATLTECAR